MHRTALLRSLAVLGWTGADAHRATIDEAFHELGIEGPLEGRVVQTSKAEILALLRAQEAAVARGDAGAVVAALASELVRA